MRDVAGVKVAANMIQAMLVRQTVPIEQPTMMDTLGRELMGMLDPTQDKVRTKQFFSGAVEIDRSLNSPGMKMKPRCGVCVLGPTWMARVWSTRWTTRSLLSKGDQCDLILRYGEQPVQQAKRHGRVSWTPPRELLLRRECCRP